LISKPVGAEYRNMSTEWISRLARACVALYKASAIEIYPAEPADRDADRRRIRSELEAIRVRFPDHA
jgi:hypothetical protein